MIKNVRLNYKALELFLVFWEMNSGKDKTPESFIIDMADTDEMKLIYHDEFDEESCRRVLSSIVNRELLNNATADEKRFWSNNMWMIDDLGVTQMMLDPIKQLNFNDVKEELGKGEREVLEIVFVPGTLFDHMIVDDKLVINFFSISVDLFGGTNEVTYLGKDLKEGLVELINKM